MIMAAIEDLDDKNGSNKSAILNQIEATHPNLPAAAHATLLSHHLNRMTETGQLALVKNNYMKPDPNAPPPKPKTPLPSVTVVSSPRPRARPPKAKDPFAPATSPKKTSSDHKTHTTNSPSICK
ncbi:hypothetical protein Tsubulata_018766 [Turnera subulata]|uniref:H15 domain-containing protein n=1 Tax=Turnera subulata TaxID=218843 RepID=A0A9Q0FLE2_9ROSI|nr:hypothetical protein Tsubulata_018766 [Turnera subulata]